jgi:hypothetical protein
MDELERNLDRDIDLCEETARRIPADRVLHSCAREENEVRDEDW